MTESHIVPSRKTAPSPIGDLRKSWEPVLKAMKGDAAGCLEMVSFAIRSGLRPTEFSDAFLDEWEDQRKTAQVSRGMKHSSVSRTHS